MLTSISPLGERARGNRWVLTVSAYLLGSVVSGAAWVGTRFSDYTGSVYPVSAVLLLVVALLCVEWTARKLLRLA